MIRRIADGTGGGFPRAAVAQMWRLIISSAINIEEDAKIATVSNDTTRDCYWLAREYFGGFTPITQHPTVIEALQAVIDQEATVGVVPLWDKESSRTWWSRIEEGQDLPKIFAKVPFIQLAPSTKTPLVAIGHVEPEPTGDDESIWVIRADASIQYSALEQLLDTTELTFDYQETCRVLDNPTTHHHLMKFDGFIAEDDITMKQFLKEANENFPHTATPIAAFYLGSYARPIMFSQEP